MGFFSVLFLNNCNATAQVVGVNQHSQDNTVNSCQWGATGSEIILMLNCNIAFVNFPHIKLLCGLWFL